MVDYNGNVSEPRLFLINEDEEITREMIPDEALYNAVLEQVGDTIGEAAAFTGTLNLSGTAVNRSDRDFSDSLYDWLEFDELFFSGIHLSPNVFQDGAERNQCDRLYFFEGVGA